MLRATYEHPLAEEYARPGGPWDLPSLDALLSANDDDHTAARIARLAGNLAGYAVGPGDVVCWQAPNSIEVVNLYRACWRIGAVAAPLHHALGDGDTAALVDAAATERVRHLG